VNVNVPDGLARRRSNIYADIETVWTKCRGQIVPRLSKKRKELDPLAIPQIEEICDMSSRNDEKMSF
jgi:hypothetical protein